MGAASTRGERDPPEKDQTGRQQRNTENADRGVDRLLPDPVSFETGRQALLLDRQVENFQGFFFASD
jgi:hypothetical protein